MRPRFYSFSNQMVQFNTNSRVIVSGVDVNGNVSLSSVRRVPLNMPNARRRKLSVRYLTHSRGKICSRSSRHGEKSSVEEISGTIRRVLWRTSNTQRERSCGRCVAHAGKRPVQEVSDVTEKVCGRDLMHGGKSSVEHSLHTAEQSCRRHVMDGRKSPVENVKL